MKKKKKEHQCLIKKNEIGVLGSADIYCVNSNALEEVGTFL